MTRGAVPPEDTARQPTRPASTGLGIVSLGSLLSGAGAYAVIALGTRAVGDVAFAPVSVLWSLWALSAAAITFPVQHWVIRSAEVGGEGSVWSVARRLFLGSLAAAVGLGGLALVAGPRLYPSSWTAFAVMTACLPLGSLAVGFQRGMLAHRGRFRDVAFSLAGENGFRAVVAGAVLAGASDDLHGARLIGWGIVAGFGVALTRPSAFRRLTPSVKGEDASMRLLGGFAGANVAAQATLTSGPVVLALVSAPAPVITQVFAVLALLRVPYTGVVGASAAITGPLTRLVTADDDHRLRRMEVGGALTAVMLAAVAWPLAPVVLPPLVGLLFGVSVTISPTAQGLLAAGGVLALAGLLSMLVQVARDRPRKLLGAWVVALLAGACALLVPTSAVLRVSLAFLVAEGTALVALTLSTGEGLAIRLRSGA